ncbi:MAG: Ig-like domain-containing protein, partial [Chlorobiaceae bacterium]|nr:Ig-like domain-containing protein [Chlorobiaceae bacterium]
MATYTKTGTVNNDSYTLGSFNGSKPPSGNIYILDGLAGNDTLRLGSGNSYLDRYLSTDFTIEAVDANGFIVVTGASIGGTKLTLQLKSVETLVFSDKSVTLNYMPADTTAPTVTTFSPADNSTGAVVGSNIVVTFSEAVQRGAGLIEIRQGSAGGTVVASYDAATSGNL